ncbi:MULTISPECIES: hypothetical protein [Colwellia]|nr:MULTISPECIES: hypothetical protein [Colwellia]
MIVKRQVKYLSKALYRGVNVFFLHTTIEYDLAAALTDIAKVNR